MQILYLRSSVRRRTISRSLTASFASTTAQVKRLCTWTEGQVAQLQQENQEQQLPPPPPPLPTVPTVYAAPFVSPLPVAPVPRVQGPVQFIADSATLAKVAALKAGPRVGPSPATVLEMYFYVVLSVYARPVWSSRWQGWGAGV